MKIRDIVIPNANNGPNESWEFINYVDTGSCTKNEISHLQKIKRGFYPSRAKRIVNKNDIIISTVRPNQCHYAIIKEPMENMVVSTGFTVLTPKENVIPEYLYFFLTQETITKRLSILAEGATTSYPSITPDDILDIEINLPDLDYQKLVVDVLWPIEEKIILIKKINTELENLAKTIYNYWFVQFDFPNEEGKPYKTSGGEMVWNEELKREIPKGLKFDSLKRLFEIQSGYPFESEDYRKKGDYKLITIKNVQDGFLNTNETDFIEFLPKNLPDYCKLKLGDLLMSLTGNVGRVCIVTEENLLLNQRVGVVNPQNQCLAFTYFTLQSDFIVKTLKKIATGSNQKNLSPIEAGEEKALLPDENIMKLFEKKTKPFFDMILKNQRENQELIKLRDFLLPMLMNGQVKVKSEAKEQLSMAAEPQVKYGK